MRSVRTTTQLETTLGLQLDVIGVQGTRAGRNPLRDDGFYTTVP
jgi:hypothetical protein